MCIGQLLRPRRLRAAAARFAAGALLALTVATLAHGASDSPAIIESPRAKLTLDDYEAEMAKLTPSARAQFAASRVRLGQVLDNMYLNRALAADARAQGLEREPVLSRQIELQVEKLIAQAVLEKLDRDTGAAFDANPEKYAARAREIYITQPDRFRTPERVRVSHVLIKVKPDRDDQAARQQAEALQVRVAGGAALPDLAREFSDDLRTKGNGGDLGWVAASQLDPAFAAAAFALRKPGDLAPVTKTRFGYHVIQFHGREAPAQRPLAEVKGEVLATIRHDVVGDARKAYIEKILTDPAPKVNEALIEKISREARTTATAIEGSAPGKP